MVSLSSPWCVILKQPLVSYSENSCYVMELRILYIHQKYTMPFSSNTNIVFMVALKIVELSVGFFLYSRDYFTILEYVLLFCT